MRKETSTTENPDAESSDSDQKETQKKQ
jgi:hypothetical protein